MDVEIGDVKGFFLTRVFSVAMLNQTNWNVWICVRDPDRVLQACFQKREGTGGSGAGWRKGAGEVKTARGIVQTVHPCALKQPPPPKCR